MIPLDPLPNLIDQVYARILEAITDRTLPPGHRIRQNELADPLGVEPGNLEAAAAALGDEALPVQQMQRVGHRLARYAELFCQLVLPDAMPGRQRAIGDRLEDPDIDLLDQVGERIQWDHAGRPVWNTEFRIQN